MRVINAVMQKGRRAGRAVLRSRAVAWAVRDLSHIVAAAPARSPWRLLAPIRSVLKGEVTVPRVLEICSTLDGAGIRFCLAGGWGIDALVGRQSRRHDDVDIAIADFDRTAPIACAALEAVGFECKERQHQPVWMPDQWALEDSANARIDLLSIDLDLLERSRHEGSSLVRDLGPGPVSFDDCVVTGTVGDRHLPCLSAAVQRLFHSGFFPRQVHLVDLAALDTEDTMDGPDPTPGSASGA